MDWSSGYNNSCSKFFSKLLLQEMGTSRAHKAETRRRVIRTALLGAGTKFFFHCKDALLGM